MSSKNSTEWVVTPKNSTYWQASFDQLEEAFHLTYAEFKVYSAVRALYPYSYRVLVCSKVICERLKITRQTFNRAIKVLRDKGYRDIQVVRVTMYVPTTNPSIPEENPDIPKEALATPQEALATPDGTSTFQEQPETPATQEVQEPVDIKDIPKEQKKKRKTKKKVVIKPIEPKEGTVLDSIVWLIKQGHISRALNIIGMYPVDLAELKSRLGIGHSEAVILGIETPLTGRLEALSNCLNV